MKASATTFTMENEEEEDEIFTAREVECDGQENVEEPEDEQEPGEDEPDTERKDSLDIPVPSRSLGSRRASLPCPVSTRMCILFIPMKICVYMNIWVVRVLSLNDRKASFVWT